MGCSLTTPTYKLHMRIEHSNSHADAFTPSPLWSLCTVLWENMNLYVEDFLHILLVAKHKLSYGWAQKESYHEKFF